MLSKDSAISECQREEEPLDEEWIDRVMAGSVAYCRLVRDAEHAVKWPEDRLMFLHERAI